jgi:SsrA-binding protein
MFIPEYEQGNRANHEPRRGRKMLLRAKQIRKLIGELKVQGNTLVPLVVYFGKNGYAKVELALAKGKKQYEKRDSIKERDWQRQRNRLLKN